MLANYNLKTLYKQNCRKTAVYCDHISNPTLASWLMLTVPICIVLVKYGESRNVCIRRHSTAEDINSTSVVSDLDAYSVCFQDGPGSTWTALRRLSCWCSWLLWLFQKRHLSQRCSATSQPLRGGVGTIWNQTRVFMGSWRIKMRPCLWNMMDTGGMRERREWPETGKKMRHC